MPPYKFVGETKLAYSGNASEFKGEVEVRQAGSYEAMVYAWDPENGNTGVARASTPGSLNKAQTRSRGALK